MFRCLSLQKERGMLLRMGILLMILLVLALTQQVQGSSSSAHVVQFVVHANEKSDVTRLFTGAYVDFTWNNVFVVSIWTNEPDSLMRSVK
jgi:hypothetical protein